MFVAIISTNKNNLIKLSKNIFPFLKLKNLVDNLKNFEIASQLILSSSGLKLNKSNNKNEDSDSIQSFCLFINEKFLNIT